MGFLLGLASRGVCLAILVTKHAVRSYRTFSPLPEKYQAVSFLWHCPLAHALQTLSGTLPYEARTFLCMKAYSDCLAGSDDYS